MGRNKDWNRKELGLAVSDYLEMLRKELRGLPYMKTDHRRRLNKYLNRSSEAIEFMHQNISAVMELLGFPIIRGYLPRPHFNGLLIKVIEQELRENEKTDLLHSEVNLEKLPGTKIVESPLPSRTESPQNRIRESDDQTASELKKLLDAFENPALRDARAHQLGEAGERFFLDRERERLDRAGHGALASKVKWVAKDYDGAGYDILSYTTKGAPRHLEIKTTAGGIYPPFWITANELEVSERRSQSYEVIRIFDFRPPSKVKGETKGIGFYRIRPPLEEKVILETSSYRALLR